METETMRIAVVFGSQRQGGTHGKIEEELLDLGLPHEFDFIRMAETRIEGCVACEGCAHTGRCVLPSGPDDRFEEALSRLVAADAILVVSPVYAPIPSRLTALFERLLSVSYFGSEIGKLERPLKGKRAGIICYHSAGIADATQMKMLFQKFLMDNYSFTHVEYDYVDHEPAPEAKPQSVVDYVKNTILNL